MKRILMVLTSHEGMLHTDSKTGLWIGEFTDPYYEFRDAEYTVTLASPKGGSPPIDSLSELTEHITSSNRRFVEDDFAQHALKHTLTLEAVEATDFDAIFYPGGHGPMFDLASNQLSAQLILDFIKQNKPVAAVCHGPAALIQAAKMDSSLLLGKKITGFSNAEEVLVMRSDNIPFHLEDKLTWLGGKYEKSLIPFTSHVVKDGLLITGQNPLSASPTAKALIKHLERS